MQFAQPLFFIGLTAILVPIIIHLFNFRRYRTYYFSNVKMLQDIAQKTKRESQLQHLIVLFLRILGIVSLVFAFTQPFIPSKTGISKNSNLVSVYVDNSFSMEGNTPSGTLFTDAIDNAKQIINNFRYTDQFVLYNNDFSARQSKRLNKDEALQELDNWTISPRSCTLDELLKFEENACANAEEFNIFHYYISDFQKNNFNFEELEHHDQSNSFFIHKPAKETGNVSIDSCWFLAPIFRVGQAVTLKVRLRNCGDAEVVKLPMKLYVNGEQKALTAVDLVANSTAECQMNYTITSAGLQCAQLQIEDIPITFDNQLFFTYQVTDNAKVSVVYEKTSNRYLAALYGMDSIFSYAEMEVNHIDYAELLKSSLVVLSEVKSLSSGLANELEKYLESGGSLLVLPAMDMETASWNSFLSKCNASQYAKLSEQGMKVGNINTESDYFKGSLQNQNEALDMPTVQKYFTFSPFHAEESIMTLENRNPLLFAHSVGNGRLILSAVAMNDDFGMAHRHALFFIPLHNMGIKSVMQQKLYNTIGVDHAQTVAKNLENSEDVYALRLQNSDVEFIPEQRNMGNECLLFLGRDITEAGFYDVLQNGARQTTIALNYDRKESQLTYYSEKEMKDFIKTMPDSSQVQMYSSNDTDITHQIQESLHGRPLWRYFVFLALFFFLMEVAVLRLWGKWKLKK